MKIKFSSLIKQEDNENKIEFEAPLKKEQWEEYDVYEFLEPQNNVMNRIEISDDKVNIFAGPASIFLELQNEVDIQFQTPQGIIIMKSFLEQLDKTQNSIKFNYSLKTKNNELIGHYKIHLEIS
ncbi:DUF1934 family protein [Mycoplasma iguanae]|uniref:DUF1934 family protein n=1 Tax=Mycoplasma iguanae TaxID=292461 RepID=A0ABY5R968_9MOLU|nr:DUF1934 family protein [Mycoplasma iguanae]UVD81866.1 DUF1934 family protein [Mycoplasma iguanae]